MNQVIKDILKKFGIVRVRSICYIGGPDVLPAPLKGQEEQEALPALQVAEASWQNWRQEQKGCCRAGRLRQEASRLRLSCRH